MAAAVAGTRKQLWSQRHNNCNHNRPAAGTAAMAGKQTNSELTALQQTTTVTTTAVKVDREQLQ